MPNAYNLNGPLKTLIDHAKTELHEWEATIHEAEQHIAMLKFLLNDVLGVCARCNGTGKEPSLSYPCPNCQGQGSTKSLLEKPDA